MMKDEYNAAELPRLLFIIHHLSFLPVTRGGIEPPLTG